MANLLFYLFAALTVGSALAARLDDVSEALEAEEREERRKDREYWAPLRRELEEFRLGRRRK